MADSNKPSDPSVVFGNQTAVNSPVLESTTTPKPQTPESAIKSAETFDMASISGEAVAALSLKENTVGPSISEKAVKPTVNEKMTDSTDPIEVPVEEATPPVRMALIMVALCLAISLAALDISIVTTAIPTISGHFGSTTGFVWIGSAYTLGCTVSAPVWTKFSDIFGRRPILLAANAIFFLGSIICGAATSMNMLLAGRAIQGLGGGGLLVLPVICVSDLVSMRRRSGYYAMFGGVWAVAGSLGPVLGGVFSEKVSWRWCFYINLPIDGIAFVLILLFLNVHNPRTPIWDGLKAVDWLGTIALIGGTIMFLIGLQFGGTQFAWDSPTVICLIVFGIVTCGIFVLIERYAAPFPLIPFRLVRKPSTACVLALVWVHAMVMSAGSYFIPLYFQAVLGATPILSGVWMLPQSVAITVASVFSGIVIKKTGKYRLLIIMSIGIATVGCGLFIILGTSRNFARIILFQVVFALGIGPLFQGGLIAMQATVAPADMAAAVALVQLARNLGISVSIVIGGVMIQNFLSNRHGSELSALLPPDIAGLVLDGDIAASTILIKNLPPNFRVPIQVSVEDAISHMWMVYTGFCGLGLIAALFLKETILSSAHTEVKTGLDHMVGRDKTSSTDPSANPSANPSEHALPYDHDSKKDIELDAATATAPVTAASGSKV